MKKVCSYLGYEDKSVAGIVKALNIPDMPCINELVYSEEDPDIVFFDQNYYVEPEIRRKVIKYTDKNTVLFFVGREAVNPDFNICDYAISWDVNFYGTENCANVMRNGIGDWAIKDFSNDLTLERAKEIVAASRKFCCFQYSNPNAHPQRDRLFYEISKYKQVDSIGSHLNNVGNISTRDDLDWMTKSIMDKAKYKFSIAAENLCMSGYTSEKIYNSLLAHTIPIYWGDPDAGRYINPKCFINANVYSSFDELRKRIREIDSNDRLYMEMLLEPFQTPEQIAKQAEENEAYKKLLEKIFTKETKDLIRRPMGTWTNVYRDSYLTYTCENSIELINEGKVSKARKFFFCCANEGFGEACSQVINKIIKRK